MGAVFFFFFAQHVLSTQRLCPTAPYICRTCNCMSKYITQAVAMRGITFGHTFGCFFEWSEFKSCCRRAPFSAELRMGSLKGVAIFYYTPSCGDSALAASMCREGVARVSTLSSVRCTSTQPPTHESARQAHRALVCSVFNKSHRIELSMCGSPRLFKCIARHKPVTRLLNHR